MFNYSIINSLAMLSSQDLGYYGGAIFVFGLMIIAHEFGHFIIAKRMGIRVLEFSLGFGPKILSRKKGETFYSWRAIPLGGFVHMTGEDAGESDPNDPHSFQNKSFAARMATVAAGPVMNYILAFIIFFFLFLFIGDSPFTTELGKLNPGFPAYNAGLKQGDIVLSVNGNKLTFEDGMKMRGFIKANAGKQIELLVNRNGSILTYQVTPTAQGILGFEMSRASYVSTVVEKVMEHSPEENAGLKKGDQIKWVKIDGDENPETLDYNSGMKLIQYIRTSDGRKIAMHINRGKDELNIEFIPEYTLYSRRIRNLTMEYEGFSPDKTIAKITSEKEVQFNFYLSLIYKRQAPLTALVSASKEIYMFSTTLLTAIPRLIKREIPLDLTGPIGIIVAMRDIGKDSGIYQFIRFAAVLNICIGLFNLLPIPALDGMRLLFLAIGAVRRKTINQQTEGIVHYIGFGLLLLLMIIVTYYDVQRLWRGESIIPK